MTEQHHDLALRELTQARNNLERLIAHPNGAARDLDADHALAAVQVQAQLATVTALLAVADAIRATAAGSSR
ncbi:hypothetical protein ACODT5_15470 [Streptomyces sp. 5.8]|uniref:hypothetical protein n=1 Tax=Streptomyces sp. 5.8 TaxID=3406571 RepID=UPI003BB7BAD0